MNVAVVPVEHNIRRAKECVGKNREGVFNGAEHTEGGVGIVPDEVVVLHVDGLGAEDKVDGTALAGVMAVDSVDVDRSDIGSRRECSEEVVEDGGRQGAEGPAAVEQDGLAASGGRCGVDIDDASVGLVDLDSVESYPPPSQAIRGLRGGNDRSLEERPRVLLGVDAAVDHGPRVAGKAAEIHAECAAVCDALQCKAVDNERVGAGPAREVRTGTHNSDRHFVAIVGGTKDLLGDGSSAEANIVAHIFEVGVTSSIRDGALDAIIDYGGGKGEPRLCIAKARPGGLGAGGVDPELRGTRVELDGHRLPGRAQPNVHCVQRPGQGRRRVGVDLSLCELADNGRALGGRDGDSDEPWLLHHTGVAEQAAIEGESGGREGRGEESEGGGRHVDERVESTMSAWVTTGWAHGRPERSGNRSPSN